VRAHSKVAPFADFLRKSKECASKSESFWVNPPRGLLKAIFGLEDKESTRNLSLDAFLLGEQHEAAYSKKDARPTKFKCWYAITDGMTVRMASVSINRRMQRRNTKRVTRMLDSEVSGGGRWETS
jgi:hypothetical protein